MITHVQFLPEISLSPEEELNSVSLRGDLFLYFLILTVPFFVSRELTHFPWTHLQKKELLLCAELKGGTWKGMLLGREGVNGLLSQTAQ